MAGAEQSSSARDGALGAGRPQAIKVEGVLRATVSRFKPEVQR